MERSLDQRAILKRLGGNAQLFDTICDRFLKLLPDQLAVIGDSLATGDVETLKRSVHRLKGSVGYFDSSLVMGTIIELENVAKKTEYDEPMARFLFERLNGRLMSLVEELKELRRTGLKSD